MSLTSHRTIFVHFRKKWSAARHVRVSSMQTRGNPKNSGLINKPHWLTLFSWILPTYHKPFLLSGWMDKCHIKINFSCLFFGFSPIFWTRNFWSRLNVVEGAHFQPLHQTLTVNNKHHHYGHTYRWISTSYQSNTIAQSVRAVRL